MKVICLSSLFIGIFVCNLELYAMDKKIIKLNEVSVKPLIEEFVLEGSMLAGKDSRGDHKRELQEKFKKIKPISPRSDKIRKKEQLIKLLADAVRSLQE